MHFRFRLFQSLTTIWMTDIEDIYARNDFVAFQRIKNTIDHPDAPAPASLPYRSGTYDISRANPPPAPVPAPAGRANPPVYPPMGISAPPPPTPSLWPLPPFHFFSPAFPTTSTPHHHHHIASTMAYNQSRLTLPPDPRIFFKESPFYTVLTSLSDYARCPGLPIPPPTLSEVADRKLRCNFRCSHPHPSQHDPCDRHSQRPSGLAVASR